MTHGDAVWVIPTAQSAVEGTQRGPVSVRAVVRSICTSGRWVTVAWKLPVRVLVQLAGRTVACTGHSKRCLAAETVAYSSSR